jgi:hypothetical protein
VLFSPNAEPAIDWFEIESRLQNILTGARPADLPVGPSVTLANDRATANDPTLPNDPPVLSDPPVINPGFAEMLSLLGEGTVSLSPRQDIAEFSMGVEASASVPPSAVAFDRGRAGSN